VTAIPGGVYDDGWSEEVDDTETVVFTSTTASPWSRLHTVVLNGETVVADGVLLDAAPTITGITSVALVVSGEDFTATLVEAAVDVDMLVTYRPISYADVFTADADAGDSTPTDDDALEIRYRDEGGMWSSWRRIELNDRSLFYTLRHLGIYRERQYEVRALTRTQMHLVYIEDDVEALRS
jgi:hypothetical protein